MANFELENEIYKNENISYVCGIDEAGRGPWAGPVVAAAVIINKLNIPKGINDSKKLSAKAREQLASEIFNTAISIGIGIIEAEEIDKINILQATFKAMRIAVSKLKTTPQYCLIDGNRDPKIGIDSDCIIKGDAKSISIAAASIIAKQTRDQIMKNAHEIYPYYGFDKNAGYGVPNHIEGLNKFGPCPIHRFSFKPIKQLTVKNALKSE